jgi:hypothetical protein
VLYNVLVPGDLVPTTSQHLPELTQFLLQVFQAGGDAPFVRPKLMQWKYFTPRPDWSGARSYLLFGQDRISAHGCVVPAAFRTPAGRVTAMRVIDWAGSRHTPAAGVMAMRKLAQLTDVVLAIGGSPDAVRVFPKMKFDHRGDAGVYVRVVRPWRQFRTDPFPRGWKAPLRLARNTLWSFSPVLRPPREWSATRVKQFDDSLAVALAFLPKTFITTERSPGVLNYMLGCPGGAFSGFVIRQAQQVRGYFILSHVAGQTRIAEAWVNSEQPADWQAAIGLATGQAAAMPETCEILAVNSIRLGREALERNGFRFRRNDPIFVLDPQRRLTGLPELHLTLLDGDESYLSVPGYPYET